MYKKSYTGFIVWLLVFLGGMAAICFCPVEDESVLVRLIILLMSWFVAGLTFHIWRTEQIYWYTGTTFEEAEAAGPERRREFAWKHFRIFGRFALLVTVVSCATYLLGWSFWIDFAFGTVGLIAAAVRTMPIKL